MDEKKISILLVDDHLLFRNGFRLLLDHLPEVDVIGEAADGEGFLELLSQRCPDIVFLDISMPGMGGLVAAQKALSMYSGLKIIMLTMYSDESYYYQLADMGVKGFLLKSCDFREVEMAIQTAMSGGTYLSQELMVNIVNSHKPSGLPVHDATSLSDRENEILVEVCKGASTSEIAEKFCISPRTVEKHRANILLKTGCKNTASLVGYAMKNRLT